MTLAYPLSFRIIVETSKFGNSIEPMPSIDISGITFCRSSALGNRDALNCLR
jgi:hypothetical protein